MIPTRFALALLLVLTLLVIFGFVDPRLAWTAVALDALVVALAWLDARLARRTPLDIARRLPSPIHQGEPVDVVIAIRNPASRTLRVRVREILAPALTADAIDASLALPPRSRLEHRYTVTPRWRGDAEIAPLAVRVRGPLGLSWAEREAASGARVRVFPRKHLEGDAALYVRLAEERRLGAAPRASRGISHEIYGVREYLPGDEYRMIHWKAAARLHRPVTRETTWEQHQRLVILVDCGRPMASLALGLSKLDHTLAAVIALLRVVLAQEDDAVLVLFGKEIRRVVRVGRRTRSFASVFEAVYDEQANLEEPDYAQAVSWCARQAPRRSLVLLCTSVLDLLAADELGRSLVGLAARHRALLVNLEDDGLTKLCESIPPDALHAYAKAAALGMRAANRELATRLAHRGVDTLSAPASRLTIGLIERYLDFKAQHVGARRAAR